MRRVVGPAFGLVVLLVLLPFVGPSLGLTSYEPHAAPPASTATLATGRINYRQVGDGPDVLVIHGQPGSTDMMWPLAEALAERGFRVTTYDRMGWGHSDAVAADVTANPTTHARDAVALVEALALEAPVVVGYSYGGGVAIEMERLQPGRIRTMALISSVGGPRRPDRPTAAGRITSAPIVLRWFFGTDVTARAAARGAFATFAAPETLQPEQSLSLLASLALPGIPTNWARERDEREQDFGGYHPERVAACTLVVHGEEDGVVSPEVGRFVASAIAGARFVGVPAAGHAIVLTRAPALADLIARHRDACRDAGGRPS